MQTLVKRHQDGYKVGTREGSDESFPIVSAGGALLSIYCQLSLHARKTVRKKKPAVKGPLNMKHRINLSI